MVCPRVCGLAFHNDVTISQMLISVEIFIFLAKTGHSYTTLYVGYCNLPIA